MQINRSSSTEEFCSSNGAQCFHDAIVISCGLQGQNKTKRVLRLFWVKLSQVISVKLRRSKMPRVKTHEQHYIDSFTSLRMERFALQCSYMFIVYATSINQYTGASADQFWFLGIVLKLHRVLLLPFSSDAVADSAKLKSPRIRFPHGPILPGSPLHGSTHLQMGHTKCGGTSGYLTLAPAKKTDCDLERKWRMLI